MATQSALDVLPLPVADGGTGRATLTAHALYVGNGTSAPTALTVGTNGQVMLGSTTADPAFATLSSSDSSLTYTTGAHSLGIAVTNPVYQASVTLTSAQIQALRATPITVVAAPASGKTLHFLDGQAKLVYGGTNAFTNPQNLAIKYQNGSGVAVSASITGTGFEDQTANTYNNILGVANAIVVATGAEAQALVIHNTGGSEITGNAAGDNTIVVTVRYAILTQ